MVLIGLLIFAAAVVIVLLFCFKQTGINYKQSVNSETPVRLATKSNAHQSQLAQPTSVPRNALMVELEQTANFAVFYARYKNSTNPIERYMAFKSFNDCRIDVGIIKELKGINSANAYAEDILARSKNPNFNRDQRLKLARNTWERCAGFTRTLESVNEANAIANSLGKQGELPLGAGVFLEKNKDNPLAIGKLLDATAKLDNGYVWLETLPLLSGYSDQLWIDGKVVNSEEVKELSNALTMAACDLGQVCNAGSRLAVMYCIEFGECSSDVAYAIQQHVLTPAENERAIELREKVINAIRQRNQSFFTLREAPKK